MYKFSIALISVLALSGCASPADLSNALAQLKGDTATACVTVQGPWGTVTAVRVNQNQTTVDLPCKISQGMSLSPTNITVSPGATVNLGKQ